MLRKVASVSLLLLQVAGLCHLAASDHALSETGAVLETAALTTEPHDAPQEHLCAGDVAVHDAASTECLVLAFWRSGLVSPGRTDVVRPGHVEGMAGSPLRQRDTLAVLARAPKSSPPAG